MGGVFTIPVAFVVYGETELDAAKILISKLVEADLVKNSEVIDCWYTPNHPEADHSDADDPKLVWVTDAEYHKKWK